MGGGNVRRLGVAGGRAMLLSSVSLLTLFAVPALTIATARAQQNVWYFERYGSPGTAHSGSTMPTAGTNGGSITLFNNTYSTTTATGVAVLLGSVGGRGGAGSREYDVDPGRPGNGGDILLVQNGALAGSGDQALGAAGPRDLKGLCATGYRLSCASPPADLVAVPYDPAQTIYANAYRETRWSNRGGALLLLYSQGADGSLSGRYAAPGGNGGAIDVTLNASVSTTGKNYGGLWARSLGGNAKPDMLRSYMAEGSYAAGNGGAVSVTLGTQGSVRTNGTSAPAVIAESLGGKGHTPQFTEDTAWLFRGTKGGDGGAVALRNAGSVSTQGDMSVGVLLQSAGGDGGSLAWHAAGDGGQGGRGGDIDAVNAGTISTNGKYSFGLFAQSTGGNGGAGASGVFIGSDGGAGGKGGNLRISNYGTVATKGEGASAILAQSVAGGMPTDAFQMQAIVPGSASPGGGGAGGNAFFISGNGGTGGDGGTVQVVQAGTVKTEGNGAYGIVAQSIGGGGGRAGLANSATPFIGFGLGGAGGGGGNGGDVLVQTRGSFGDPATDPALVNAYNWAMSLDRDGSLGALTSRPTPSITTSGNTASGIVAMSVGGGGGMGGSASSSSVGNKRNLVIAIGGSGGNGGNGGKVEVNNESNISTSGLESSGIKVRSIGGGGGIAGSAAAYASAIAPPTTPAIGVTFSLGGSGGGGGSGGQAVARNYAAIATTGSSSDGIDLMSVGGGGGDGGSASSLTETLGFLNGLTVALAIGGSGGDGGDGGAVLAGNWGTIATSGNFSTGISAVSIGGGGGKGGSGDAKGKSGLSWNDFVGTATGALPTGDALAIAGTIGGTGGAGGHGGLVTVENYNSISTGGANSKGIFAQSVGGGGGSAGGYMASGEGSFNVSLQFGRTAAGGGNGGAVSVTNAKDARIETVGNGSVGIFAQSVGGGGGDGGSFSGTVKAPVDISKERGKFLLQATEELFKANDLAVYVNGFSANTTEKKLAEAGKDLKPGEAPSSNDKSAVQKFLDKKGGAQAGIGILKSTLKMVKATMKAVEGSAAAKTDADAAAAIALGALSIAMETFKGSIKDLYKAQNFPEGKGLPSVDVSVTLGGKGGAGGDGGAVSVANDGAVVTWGDTSTAIMAQSVGGGGGRGGAALATGTNKLNVNVAIGGSGGAGGHGGSVTVENSGAISTHGGASFGIFAQSVGGGGGVGGAASSANSISLHVDGKVGGSGGKSSDGGTVSVTNSGTIRTTGKESHGIVAQSVGGGGGAMLISRIDPDSADVLANSKDSAEVIQLAEDVLKLAAGRTLNSSTATSEEKAQAQKIADLLAQNITGSIGGGTGDVSTTILPTPSLGRSIGGDGGAAGNGAKVSVNHSGTIVTEGLGAMGIFAQSIGGGGGFGADAGADGVMAVTGRIGGTGGAGGNGGAIAVKLGKDAVIGTSGYAAHGMFLQSIGGGGGYNGVGVYDFKLWRLEEPAYKWEEIGGVPVVVGYGASGNGGAITVTSDSGLLISTTGGTAHGIFAQSLGGGGGAFTHVPGTAAEPVVSDAKSRDERYFKGQGGTISVDTRGTISATGQDSYAIFLQSGVQRTDGSLDSGRKGGNITVKHAGVLTGGSGSGAAIRIDGGDQNLIEIAAGSVVSAASGKAITTSFGNETLRNSGTIIGDVYLGTGQNEFDNLAGSTYISRAGQSGRIELGDTGYAYFRAGSTLDIAGYNTIGTLNILSGTARTPCCVAYVDGTLKVDVDSLASGQKSDLLVVDGPLTVTGQIQPHVVGALTPGASFTIAEARLIDLGYGSKASVASQPGSPIAWSVSKEVMSGTQSELHLTAASANFAGAAQRPLTPTEAAYANSLQKEWNSGQADMAATFGALAGVTSVKDYQKALDTASPEGDAQPAVAQSRNVSLSMTSAMSCPVFVDSGTFISESQCAWARVTGTRTTVDDFAGADGSAQSSVSFRTGAQWEIAKDWFLGATAAYTSSWGSNSDDDTSFNGNGGDVSLALKHQMGPWLLAGALNFGYGVNTIHHQFDLGDERWSTSNDSTVWTGGFRARAAYEFAFSGWYLRPYVDADVIYTSMGGYTMRGDLFDMKIGAMNEWTFALHPAVEIGARLDLTPGTWLRPYFTAGLTWLSADGLSTQVELITGTGNGTTFTSTSYMPQLTADVGVGLQLYAQDKYELRAEYRAQIGDHFLSQEGSLRLATRF